MILLIVFGSLIGLFLGILLILIVMGAVNAFYTQLLWFPVRGGWLAYLSHGIVLALILGPTSLALSWLLAAAFPALAQEPGGTVPEVGFTLPSVLVSLVTSLVSAPVFGFLMVRIASIWRVPGGPPLGESPFDTTDSEEVPPGYKKCVACDAIFPDSKTHCTSCGSMAA